MKVDLAGKSALVTGGGRGIGRVIATQLVQNGARVTIATRTEASGAAVRDELRAMGGEVELVALDLSTRAACDAAV
ncbi:MAG: SDR family NAD(P)-dependent oxidoreductase, partial [Sphingopyxis sp.]